MTLRAIVGSSSSALSQFLQNVITRARVANSINTGLTTAYGASIVVNRGGPISNMRGAFFNGIISSGGAFSEKPNAAPMTIKMTVQWPAGVGTPVALTWGGNVQGTIPGAASQATILQAIGESDDTPLGFTIPQDALVRIAIQITCASGIVYSDMGGAGLLPTDVCITGPGRDYTMDVVTPAGNATNVCIYPWAIASMQSVRESGYHGGDSIDYGYLDNVTNSPLGDIGLMSRLFGKAYPYINGGCTGESLVNFLLSCTARIYVAKKYCRHATFKMGTNDILSGGRSQAQVWTDLQTAYALFPSKLGRVTLPPLYPSTTDSGVTEANQTANAAYDVSLLNNSIRSGGGIVFDPNHVWASAATQNKWKAPNDTKPLGSVLGVLTADFPMLHPSYTAHQLLADSGYVQPLQLVNR